MDTKGPINPPVHNQSYIQVIIDAFSHFVVTVPIKTNNAKTAIKTLLHHWIIKFGPPIYLVTDRGSEYVNKELTHLCTLCELDTSLEQLILLGQMASSKYRTETLVLIYECFSMTLLKIGPSKSMCMPTHIILNLFQNSMFLLMNMSFTHDPEYHLRLIQTLTEIHSKCVFPNIVLNFQNTLILTKQIKTFSFTEHFLNPFHNGFSRRNCHVTIILYSIRKHFGKSQLTCLYYENRFGLDHVYFLTDCLMLHTNFSHKPALQYEFIEII